MTQSDMPPPAPDIFSFQPRKPNDIDVIIGKRLRKLRRQLGIRQADLAKQIGISFPQVQKYESGENRITVTTLLRICSALNLRPVDFLTLVCADIAAKQPITLHGLQHRPPQL